MNRPGKDRLGRGLGALLGDFAALEVDDAEVRRIRVDAVGPNPLQPRQDFDESELNELASSIRENGLLQPLLVRPSPSAAGRFELVAGERRLRAVRALGWDAVPVLVREVEDETLLILALVENLQREELNPLEEAEGYRTLTERFGLTQADIARSVGKDRSTVANLLRLLRLPPSIRRLLQEGALSMGHARALLSVEDPIRASELARKAVAEGWSVREVERRAASRARRASGESDPSAASGPGRGEGRAPVVRVLEEALREALATKVRIRGSSRGKGVIEVPFHGAEDFERLFALIARRETSDVVN